MSPENILQFWFGDMHAGLSSSAVRNRWFMGGAAFDQELQNEFADAVEQALAGDLDHWADSADGRLALILLLDQCPRNIFRGTARAFAGDLQAVALVQEGLERGHDLLLPFDQQVFFYMPLEHAEALVHQQSAVRCFEQMCQHCSPDQLSYARANLRWAQQHRDIVAQFGRFPHRNELLGRQSTEAELRWLENGQRFGQ